MSKAKGKLYEFWNEIYTRPLWVYVGGTVEEIKAQFLNNYDEEIKIDREDFAAWTCNVIRKPDRTFGVIVYFPRKDSMRMNIIAHEATHALFYFCEAYGLEPDNDNNEHLAYFMGWICSCINKARLNAVKPINRKRNEQRNAKGI